MEQRYQGGDEMTDLQPCPCGKVPEKLEVIEGKYPQWATVGGTCCGEWSVDLRLGPGCDAADKEAMALATAEWNNATRGWVE